MQASVKQDRYHWIGGSDIPAIMNISPFKSRFRLLQEKAQVVEDTFNGSVYTDYGNTMEPKIRSFINDELGHGFVEGRHYDEENGFRIHTDGEDEVTETILEIKTTSHISDSLDGYKPYLVQILFYMALTGYDNGILAVYERPDDLSEVFDPERLHIYPVFFKEHLGLVKEIENAVDRFKADLQRLKADPFLTEADFVPTDIIGLSDSILALESILDSMKDVENRIKNMKKELYRQMQERDIKTWLTPGGFKITRVDGAEAREEEISELDINALKRDLPELFKPDYDGGYMVTRKVKKGGRVGFVKITKTKEKEI